MRSQTQRLLFDERAVRGVAIETISGTWRITRTAPGWRIVAPIQDIADAAAVNALIRAMRRAPNVRAIARPDDLASYGLNPPLAKISLEGVAVPPLEIGAVAPTGEGVYARLTNDPALIVLELPAARPLAEIAPSALRDRSILGMSRGEVRRIEISPAGIRLAPGADGWWIESPRRLPASPARVDALLGAVSGASIAEWDDAGTAADPRYGLGEGALKVSLSGGGASAAVTVGGDAGNGRRYVVSDSRSSILIVTMAPPASIPHELESLRDPRLTNVNRYTVSRIEYSAGGAHVAADRTSDAVWTTNAHGTIRAENVLTLLAETLEMPTTAWRDGSLGAAPSTTLDYATESGAKGRVEFAGARATWDALPGVVFTLAAAAPPAPAWASGQ